MMVLAFKPGAPSSVLRPQQLAADILNCGSAHVVSLLNTQCSFFLFDSVSWLKVEKAMAPLLTEELTAREKGRKEKGGQDGKEGGKKRKEWRKATSQGLL